MRYVGVIKNSKTAGESQMPMIRPSLALMSAFVVTAAALFALAAAPVLHVAAAVVA